MTAARIILWRHGRTEWNIVDRFQGQADIPVDDVGYAQAVRAAEVLAAYRPTGLYSSDLARCYQTAALAERTGLEIITDKRLREIHVGSWRAWSAMRSGRLTPSWRRLWAGEDVRRSPTGESPREVAERMTEALTEIAEAAEDHSTVVVATHGLSGRVGTCGFVGLPFEHWRLLGGLSNCAWVSIDRHRSGAYWRIEGYNLTADSDLDTG